MAQYKTKQHIENPIDESGYESGYESDGGTEYTPVDSLGEGRFAKARLFKSKNNKAVTVLNPLNIPGDFVEAKVKHRFFTTIYPDKQSHLFILGKDYRLVVPYVDYTPYEKLSIDTVAFQVVLFQSAIQALKECHDKGIIVLDLKLDNVYYDSSTQKTYFIDGGFSILAGAPLDPFVFQKTTQESVEQFKHDYAQIPPESWSIEPNAVFATPQMDIYGLGVLMLDLFDNLSPEIHALIQHCLEFDPKQRPTLDELMSALEAIKQNESVEYSTKL